MYRLNTNNISKIVLALLLVACGNAFYTTPIQADPGECVQIFFDANKTSAKHYWYGRTHVTFLQNLLGHFPEVQQYIRPISDYKANDLERCKSNIYIGTYFGNSIPKILFDDLQTTNSRFAWLGYNIWQLPVEQQIELTGHSFTGLTTLNQTARTPDDKPSFYSIIKYKGENFTKYGAFDPVDLNLFHAAFEIAKMQQSDDDVTSDTLATATNPITNESSPYIIRKNNFWYIADSPLSYAHESDRYLVFADLLFDILDQKPLRSSEEHLALARLEDIDSFLPSWLLTDALKVFEDEDIPFSTSLIPVFRDPLGLYVTNPSDRMQLMHRSPVMMRFVKRAQAMGTSFILHGFTHQLGMTPNPFTGMSGDDFEFWDANNNRSVALDSPKWALGRLEDAAYIIGQAQIETKVWLTPHYQASPLDNTIFGRVFPWTIGRVIYFPLTKYPDNILIPEHLKFGSDFVASDSEKRLKLASQSLPKFCKNLLPNGQFYPFEIYGDIYGQRIIPENIGSLQPYLNRQVHKSMSIDDMLKSAKRNLVLRDSWASLFFHPLMLNSTTDDGTGRFPGDPAELKRLIQGIRKLGYKFVDLNKWIANRKQLRPQPKYEFETDIPCEF